MTPIATELSKPEYAGLNAAQCLTKLLASTVELRDDQLYTWAGVALIVGPQNAEALRLALESNGMGWAVHQLGGSGLQLSNDLVQQALLGFAQAGVDGCAELAAKGIHLVAPWQQIGLAQEPTLAEVSDAMAAIAEQQRLGNIRTRLDAAYNKIGTTEQANAAEELRAIADELES